MFSTRKRKVERQDMTRPFGDDSNLENSDNEERSITTPANKKKATPKVSTSKVKKSGASGSGRRASGRRVSAKKATVDDETPSKVAAGALAGMDLSTPSKTVTAKDGDDSDNEGSDFDGFDEDDEFGDNSAIKQEDESDEGDDGDDFQEFSHDRYNIGDDPSGLIEPIMWKGLEVGPNHPSVPQSMSTMQKNKQKLKSAFPDPNGRTYGRHLVGWQRPRCLEMLILCLQYECHLKGINLPWDETIHRLHPGSGGPAAIQYLNKLRDQLLLEGHMIPPTMGKGQYWSKAIRGITRDTLTEGASKYATRPIFWTDKFEHRKESLTDHGHVRGSGQYRIAQKDGRATVKIPRTSVDRGGIRDHVPPGHRDSWERYRKVRNNMNKRYENGAAYAPHLLPANAPRQPGSAVNKKAREAAVAGGGGSSSVGKSGPKPALKKQVKIKSEKFVNDSDSEGLDSLNVIGSFDPADTPTRSSRAQPRRVVKAKVPKIRTATYESSEDDVEDRDLPNIDSDAMDSDDDFDPTGATTGEKKKPRGRRTRRYSSPESEFMTSPYVGSMKGPADATFDVQNMHCDTDTDESVFGGVEQQHATAEKRKAVQASMELDSDIESGEVEEHDMQAEVAQHFAVAAEQPDVPMSDSNDYGSLVDHGHQEAGLMTRQEGSPEPEIMQHHGGKYGKPETIQHDEYQKGDNAVFDDGMKKYENKDASEPLNPLDDITFRHLNGHMVMVPAYVMGPKNIAAINKLPEKIQREARILELLGMYYQTHPWRFEGAEYDDNTEKEGPFIMPFADEPGPFPWLYKVADDGVNGEWEDDKE